MSLGEAKHGSLLRKFMKVINREWTSPSSSPSYSSRTKGGGSVVEHQRQPNKELNSHRQKPLFSVRKIAMQLFGKLTNDTVSPISSSNSRTESKAAMMSKNKIAPMCVMYQQVLSIIGHLQKCFLSR